MVAVEVAAELPGNDGGETEAERAKPALSGARAEPETPRERGRWRGREGNQ